MNNVLNNRDSPSINTRMIHRLRVNSRPREEHDAFISRVVLQ